MALKDNVSAYYKLDGNSLATVGTNNGVDTAVTYSTANGKINQGAGFNGTSSRIKIADSTDYTFGSADFTINVWIKRSAVSGARESFLGQCDTGGTVASISVEFDITAANKITCYAMQGTGTVYSAASTGSIADTNWHMITFVRDAGTLRVYIDGIADGTGTITGAVNDSTNSMGLGILGDYTALAYGGAIDEFGVWKVKLTPSDITQLYNGGAGVQYPFNNPGAFFQMF